MPDGLFRAMHSHNPARYEDKSGAFAPLLSSYRGGSLSHKTSFVQAQRVLWLLTLAS